MLQYNLAEKIKLAGVIGAGGAGFPTHLKLADGIDTILVNGVECEPLLYTDYALLKTKIKEIAQGAQSLMRALSAQNVLIVIKQHMAENLGVSDNEAITQDVRFRVVRDVYPMGDELVMIYEALGKVVPAGHLPLSVGVVVVNAETAYNIYNATQDIPVTTKWITIGGNISQPVVCEVATYTDISTLLDCLGITVPADHVVIDGGPMMGKIVDPHTAKITKKTKGLLILPDNIPAVINKRLSVDATLKITSSACCQCTLCTDLCPRHLLGYPLAPHKALRTVTQDASNLEPLRTASLCSGCGVCQVIACCQGLSPSVTMGHIKGMLTKARMGYKASTPCSPIPEREYRMVPVARLKNRIGVSAFDKLPTLLGTVATKQSEYLVSLTDHIGKPSKAIVSTGDYVHAGDLLAMAEEGVSAAVHSPIDGQVTQVNPSSITMKKTDQRRTDA